MYSLAVVSSFARPTSQWSEFLVTQKQRVRLSDLLSCMESRGEATAANELPNLDFLMAELEAKSAAQHLRNLRLKTLWIHFPDNRGLNQIDLGWRGRINSPKSTGNKY